MSGVVKYNQKTYEMFTAHVNGSTEGLNYLVEYGHRELIAVIDAIRDDTHAFKFLMNNKFFIQAAFVNAIWEDKEAFKLLMQYEPEWAAMANLIEGDEKAIEFLSSRKKDYMINLALAIQKRIRQDGDRAASPFSALKSIFKPKK